MENPKVKLVDFDGYMLIYIDDKLAYQGDKIQDYQLLNLLGISNESHVVQYDEGINNYLNAYGDIDNIETWNDFLQQREDLSDWVFNEEDEEE